MASRHTLVNRTWALCCSLKLAIVLASAATFVAMAGSLVMHFNPQVFGGIDDQTLVAWWRTRGSDQLQLSWWLIPFATLVLLLGVNTLCCFLDWLRKISARWRKLGEYLIHLGCVLVLVAYLWGSFAGFRHDSVTIVEGQTWPIGGLPGHYLRLESFQPVLNKQGRPLDMRSHLSLMRGDQELQATTVSINHPLRWNGLVVVPVSFGREVTGFRFQLGNGDTMDLVPGSRHTLSSRTSLVVERFLPDAVRRGRQAVPRGRSLRDPALLVRLEQPGQPTWRGWYFLRESPPYRLLAAGFRAWPTSPLQKTYSVLTVNRDPGAGLALAGGGLIMAGILIALGSFYRKRRTGDRPELA